MKKINSQTNSLKFPRLLLFDLDKTNPKSWGKYFISNNGDSIAVSWYYNLTDATHEWIIKYKLHGAILFFNDRDELYWNAIGDQYEAPIRSSIITVNIPEGAPIDNLSSSIYYDIDNADQASFKAGGHPLRVFGKLCQLI
jgi:hypothetical protein